MGDVMELGLVFRGLWDCICWIRSRNFVSAFAFTMLKLLGWTRLGGGYTKHIQIYFGAASDALN